MSTSSTTKGNIPRRAPLASAGPRRAQGSEACGGSHRQVLTPLGCHALAQRAQGGRARPMARASSRLTSNQRSAEVRTGPARAVRRGDDQHVEGAASSARGPFCSRFPRSAGPEREPEVESSISRTRAASRPRRGARGVHLGQGDGPVHQPREEGLPGCGSIEERSRGPAPAPGYGLSPTAPARPSPRRAGVDSAGRTPASVRELEELDPEDVGRLKRHPRPRRRCTSSRKISSSHSLPVMARSSSRLPAACGHHRCRSGRRAAPPR